MDQDVGSPEPSRAKSRRVESSVLENLKKTFLKDEITSELKSLLAYSQKEILKLLKAKSNTNVREEPDEDTENEPRSFYTPTKSVRINSTQNNDPCNSRNNWFKTRPQSEMKILYAYYREVNAGNSLL